MGENKININTNKDEYIEQNGCHNCKNCFTYYDFISTTSYYCDLDKDRPRCGSYAMGEEEEFNYDNRDLEKWIDWSRKHQIEPWGICNKWDE